MMHLLTHFLSNAGEQWYIKSGLKKPLQINIHQWVKRVSILNEYLEWLPSHYYSPQHTKNIKEVVPCDEADLAELILSNMPLQWQATYNLNKKGKIHRNIMELTNTLGCIEQATPQASKPSTSQKGKGSQDSKRHPGSVGLDKCIPRKKH